MQGAATIASIFITKVPVSIVLTRFNLVIILVTTLNFQHYVNPCKIMTQEDKQLLLIDLCARLPYGVKVRHIQGVDCSLEFIDTKTNAAFVLVENSKFFKKVLENGKRNITEYKPYLRPMSSMTEEEFNEYMKTVKHSWEGIDKEEDCYYIKVTDRERHIDFLNSHHFDYRGLIEKGLALEAPERMYNN